MSKKRKRDAKQKAALRVAAHCVGADSPAAASKRIGLMRLIGLRAKRMLLLTRRAAITLRIKQIDADIERAKRERQPIANSQ